MSLYIRQKEIWKYPKLLYPVEFTKRGMSVLNLDIPLCSRNSWLVSKNR